MSKAKLHPAVMCISRSALTEQGVPSENAHGIYPINLSEVSSDQFHFINRNVVDGKVLIDEKTDKLHYDVSCILPQVLPYFVIRHKGKVLTYSRKKGEEQKLHGFQSIGFGGHIDIHDHYRVDSDYLSTIESASFRELKEELGINLDTYFNITDFTKVIIDQTNPVGNGHAGFLVFIDLADGDFEALDINTEEIHAAEWKSIVEIEAEVERYEHWSKLIIDSSTL